MTGSRARKRAVLAVALALPLAACGPAHGPTARVGPSAPAQTLSPPATTAPPSPSLPASVLPSPSSQPVRPPVVCTTASALAQWSLGRLAEQTVVVPVQESDVAAVTSEVAAGAGGVILFGNYAPANLGSQLAALASNAPGRVTPLVMTDEEGGVVQRMANLVGSMPSARDMAASMTAAQIEQLARTVGARMRAAGVTMDLAPVLDLDAGAGPSSSNPDGTRSFSANASIATPDGVAFADGLLAAGVLPVVKHFPGLGGATGNTDVEPAQTQPWASLQRAGLLPFSAAVRAGIPAVMVANASIPGLTTLPASLSSAVITGVLRNQLGFTGLVMTDSLSAIAISDAGYSVPRAAVTALAAGADMVLYNGGDPTSTAEQTEATVAAIVGAAENGALSRARLVNAVTHILAAKHLDPCA